jgi:hypothetical protein
MKSDSVTTFLKVEISLLPRVIYISKFIKVV